ncbi:copper homeostasis protein CutC [Actinoplanes sp. NBRC 103695]|uniref:copper homeostasis protein CutC n=1 Tax=Actinoplanes sp. NBRC 103695 TaxID=3032202 RepID=UPI0024A4756D|nr:copper homeostasis protein CutC [Actinoplanes sp. NBRC 103695]GLY92812.1 copper homeostasis protein CutC [Actinoplanes sp. NBRC 103695]
MVTFELAVQDTHGLAVAARLGADRIELCSALPLGGVTPSLGLIAAAAAGPEVHVLVRPRAGGFEYDADEVALTVHDVRHAVAAGAAGVVVGGLRAGRIDRDLVARVVDAAGAAAVTFHRAFDALPDPAAALDELVSLGVGRILTSGCPSTVADGLSGLTALVDAAAGRIEIMAGGGVRPDLVDSLVATGVQAIHASAKGAVADATGLFLGSAADGTATRDTTDEAEAARLLAALRSATTRI